MMMSRIFVLAGRCTSGFFTPTDADAQRPAWVCHAKVEL